MGIICKAQVEDSAASFLSFGFLGFLDFFESLLSSVFLGSFFLSSSFKFGFSFEGLSVTLLGLPFILKPEEFELGEDLGNCQHCKYIEKYVMHTCALR